MSFHEAQKQLAIAGRHALARIARDRLMAAPRLADLLAYIGEHLFDSDLSVARMKRACKVRDNGISTAFRREVGQSPRDYIAARRLETATLLLRDTDLEIWQLAETLGYSSLQVFSRAFANWCGERPSAYRARFEREKPTRRRAGAGSLSARKTERRSVGDPGAERKVAAERGGSRPAVLRSPRRRRGEDRIGQLIQNERIYELRAEAIWETLRGRPADDQRELVRATTSRSPALFHLLHRKGREEGRDDRRAGVHFAELALAALEATEHGETDEDWQALKTRAWAWLGNARTLAVDFGGAAAAFAHARRWLPEAARMPEIHAEVHYLEGVSHAYQGRLEEALERIDRGLAYSARSDDKPLRVEMLVQRGIIHIDSGRPDAGIPDLERAMTLLDGRDEPYLRLSACHSLALCLAGLGRFAEATSRLREARALSEGLGHKSLYCHVLWVEGLIAHARGDLLHALARLGETHQGFLELETPAYAAVSALDLALVHLEARDAVAAIEKAADAAELLARLGFRRETLAALRVQSRAIEDRHATLVVWREIRARLAESEQISAPTVRR